MLGFLFYGLPNLINSRERLHFDLDFQLEKAVENYSVITNDSITINASDFYSRGSITKLLFGSHYREIWGKQVKFMVYKGFDSLKFHKVGGGKQTTSIEFRDSTHRSYSFRTLDKDQSRVLPDFFYLSALRPLLRDQTCAINPYSSLVVASLADQLGIYHTSPTLAVIPYSSSFHDSTNYYLAGRAVIFEEEPGTKWKNDKKFDSPDDIINTFELQELLSKNDTKYELDTLEYLKCRLFDLLISDWDRHSHQWKWVLLSDSVSSKIRPFPIDRDMAFCRFDDGWVNSIVLLLTNHFQSFRSGESIYDIATKVTDLDRQFLSRLPESKFTEMAHLIQLNLSSTQLDSHFVKFPPEIYEMIGEDQLETFKSRLTYLPEASNLFRESILAE